ncbi:MAG: hypothetical protein NC301_07545 [Bacteroides sp.]|nr:hypothetical protein [Bacteroides sp.]MCM1380064.1 hypothetical protein [Bacteroides sp.]MCM1446341.1 hypothetical protein [Prevotella sp.]
MTPRKQIEVSKQTREMLVKLFKTTKVSVWRALAFRDNSPKSQRIRKAAEQNGGLLLLLTPAMETMHDADGFIRQYFPNDVLIEADKNTGRVELLKRGQVVKAWEHVAITKFSEIHKEALALCGGNATL